MPPLSSDFRSPPYTLGARGPSSRSTRSAAAFWASGIGRMRAPNCSRSTAVRFGRSRRLLACVRSSDTVSRQGGDELVIPLPQVTQPADAALTAEKVLLALRMPHCIDRQDLQLAASIGIVAYPDGGTEARAGLKHADLAMYRAKDSGRNTYRHASAR